MWRKAGSWALLLAGSVFSGFYVATILVAVERIQQPATQDFLAYARKGTSPEWALLVFIVMLFPYLSFALWWLGERVDKKKELSDVA
jgi:hypothetical protein